MSIQNEKLRETVEQVAEIYDANVLIYSGDIKREGADALIELCRRSNRRSNVYLFLATFGGHADAAFRIARALQRSYDRFLVHIHGICKSAGTLVTVGADELLISDFGELGPLDVQLEKDDELFGETISGLNVMQALNSLRDRAFDAFEKSLLELKMKSSGQMTTRSATDVATKFSVGLFSEIYKQIDPVRLGEIDRAINIAYAYGERLSRNNGFSEEALATLVTGYPSHGFVIDREEADSLFPNVSEPAQPSLEVAALLQDYTRVPNSSGPPLVVDLIEATTADKEGNPDDQPDGRSDEGQSPESGAIVSPDGTAEPEPTQQVRAIRKDVKQ